MSLSFMRTRALQSVLGVALLASLATGCGGGPTDTLGFGTIAITGHTSPVPGLIPTPVVITGDRFNEVIGTICLVRYEASGGATPFSGGTSSIAEVRGTITSPTTISATSPIAIICGPASVTASVTVILPSGVIGMSTGAIVIFSAPSLVSISGGGIFPAAIPTAFTITGTGFGPVGAPVTINWRSTPAGGGPLIFANGASMTTTTVGTIATATTITGVSPSATVCGPATAPAEIFRVDFGSGACTPAAGPFLPVTFVAPTIASIVNAAPASPYVTTSMFDCAIPEAFTITGTGFGPIGGTAQVRFQAPVGTPFNGGTAAIVTLTATIATATTITGVSPAALCCSANSTPLVSVTVPNGSCTPVPAATTLLAPTIGAAGTMTNTTPASPDNATPVFSYAVEDETYNLVGTGFGPIGGTVAVRWADDSGGAVYNNLTTAFVDAPGTIISRTLIQGIAPVGGFCNPPNTGATQTITATLPDGSCTAAAAAHVTQNTCTLTSIANDNGGGAVFQARNTAPFTITGDRFGPVGGSVMVTLTSTSAAPADMPFMVGGATSATIVIPGTITSRTTITGTSPLATLVPALDGGAGMNCVSLDATVSTDVLLEGGCCPPTQIMGTTITGPAMTDVDGGPAAVTVPSTIILGATDPNTFTVNGTGFGPPSSVATVRFEDTLAGGMFDGGANFADVPGTVVGTTSITGTLPTITAPRLAADLSVRVRVTFQDGSQTYCNNAVNLVAPPTITSVATTRAPFQQATPANPIANTWIHCIGTNTTITGTGFQAAITELFHDKALGPTNPIGTGILGTIPAVTPAPPALPGAGTPRTVVTVPLPSTINGLSPTDPTLTQATPVTCRVVNPDQQWHEQDNLTWETSGVLPNVNAVPILQNNAEMQISVNPTNPLNACVAAHDLRTINGQFSNQMAHAYTLDGGVTWQTYPLGPNTTNAALGAPDGFGPAPRARRFDPMGIFDAFGTYWAVYLIDDNVVVPGPTRFCVARGSTDGGVTFTVNRTMAFPASASLDRETVATGPDGLGNQALYVGLVDLQTAPIGDEVIHVGGFPITALGTIGANYAFATVTPAALPAGTFAQHGTPSVGPNGELYVSYIVGTIPALVAPTSIFLNADLDGLGAATFGFAAGGGTLVSTTDNAAPRVSIPPMPSRGKGVIPYHKVIQTGPNAGRIVTVWSDALLNPAGTIILDTTVVSQYSDDSGATWSTPLPVHGLSAGFEFMPWLGDDPVAGRGDLYCVFLDTRLDTVNNRAYRVRTTRSQNGSLWSAALTLSEVASDATIFGTNDMLEYLGVAAWNDCVYACWADNSNVRGLNPNGALSPDGFDVMTSVYAQTR